MAEITVLTLVHEKRIFMSYIKSSKYLDYYSADYVGGATPEQTLVQLSKVYFFCKI